MGTEHAIAQLRHLYAQMNAGIALDSRRAAQGLLGPAIEELERATPTPQPLPGGIEPPPDPRDAIAAAARVISEDHNDGASEEKCFCRLCVAVRGLVEPLPGGEAMKEIEGLVREYGSTCCAVGYARGAETHDDAERARADAALKALLDRVRTALSSRPSPESSPRCEGEPHDAAIEPHDAAPPTTQGSAIDLLADFYRWTQEEGQHGVDCPYGRPLGDHPGDATVKERREKGCTCGLWDLEKRADALLNAPAAAPSPSPEVGPTTMTKEDDRG
jgi:hypothetical protein